MSAQFELHVYAAGVFKAALKLDDVWVIHNLM